MGRADDRFDASGCYLYRAPVPKVEQWNLTMQRMLSQNLVMELGYVGSHGFNLSYYTDLNQVPQSQLSPNDLQYIPYQNFGQITGSTNNGISNYNSLQAQLTKRMSNGLSFSTSYVWSHFLDDQDSSGNGRSGSRAYQNAYNPSAEYSNSNFDTRNAFKAYGDYELPFGKGKRYLNSNAIADAFVGGWRISASELLMSGTPFMIAISSSYDTTFSQTVGYSTAYPNWNPGINPRPANKGIGGWFNPNAFLQPLPGTFGNVKRNSLYGPGINETNLSASKTFNLPWENIKLKIRADATNAFNHPSFGPPDGTLNCTAGPGAPCAASNNQLTSVQIGGRNVQLGAHVSF